MPLSKILLDISSELGISVSNENERAWIIDKVNDLAMELYQSKDIEGCLREQTFNLDSNSDGPQYSSLVSLPYYVYQIRGLRFSQWQGAKIPQEDMRPRYSLGKGWGNKISTPFRAVMDDAPLKREIGNASVLTFSVPLAATTNYDIYIVGKTTTAERFQEKVTIKSGETQVDSTGNYEFIESLAKSIVNNQDITVTDVENNELAVIPNSQLSAAYKIIEIQDANAGLNGLSGFNNFLSSIDILYKTRFIPFANLFDEFPCGSKCDRAIFYQFCAYYAAQRDNDGAKAQGYAQRVASILDDICIDATEGKSQKLQFGEDGFNNAQQPFRYGYKWTGNPSEFGWPSY